MKFCESAKLRSVFEGVIPKPRAFTSGARDLPCNICVPGDPSLRLRYGCAQDDLHPGKKCIRPRYLGNHLGGNGSILSRILTVSSTTVPTISRLLGLSLSTVSCGLCQNTLL